MHRSIYNPIDLADSILALLEHMECASNARPEHDRYRDRTGLLCAPEFRNPDGSRIVVENAITGWLAEFYPNARSQTAHALTNKIPDIVFEYAGSSSTSLPITVYLEAKPIWKRWITTGERSYAGISPDEAGRCSIASVRKNITQLADDRIKLRNTYEGSNDKHLLLGLVFQRPGELDDRIIEAVGPDWSHRKRHILDRCNPPGDNIGVTGMVFWPTDQS